MFQRRAHAEALEAQRVNGQFSERKEEPLSPGSKEVGRKSLACIQYFFEDLQHAFTEMEKDQHETVSLEEFYAATKGAKIPISKAALEISFKDVDVDGRGEVDYAELCRHFSSANLPKAPAEEQDPFLYRRRVTQKEAPTSLKTKKVYEDYTEDPELAQKTVATLQHCFGDLRNAFNAMDTNRKGRVSREQFAMGLRRARLPLSDEAITAVFNSLDKDKHGDICFKELVRSFRYSELKKKSVFEAEPMDASSGAAADRLASMRQKQTTPKRAGEKEDPQVLLLRRLFRGATPDMEFLGSPRTGGANRKRAPPDRSGAPRRTLIRIGQRSPHDGRAHRSVAAMPAVSHEDAEHGGPAERRVTERYLGSMDEHIAELTRCRSAPWSTPSVFGKELALLRRTRAIVQAEDQKHRELYKVRSLQAARLSKPPKDDPNAARSHASSRSSSRQKSGQGRRGAPKHRPWTEPSTSVGASLDGWSSIWASERSMGDGWSSLWASERSEHADFAQGWSVESAVAGSPGAQRAAQDPASDFTSAPARPWTVPQNGPVILPL
jgi:Ca2+-binding EF-hand superfamily protein